MIQLTQRPEQVDISYNAEPRALDIRFQGNFSALVNGNTITGINDSRMIIVFFEPPTNELFYYSGSLNIKGLEAFSKNGERIPISYDVSNDLVQNINTKVEDMTTIVDDYNTPKYYGQIKEPIVAYHINNELKYTKNGKALVDEDDLKTSQKMVIANFRRKNGTTK